MLFFAVSILSCNKRHEREVRAVAVGEIVEDWPYYEPDCFHTQKVFSIPTYPFGEPDPTAVHSVIVDEEYNFCKPEINLGFVHHCESILLNEHTKEIRYKFVGFPEWVTENPSENRRTRYNVFFYGDNPILVLD